MLNRQTLQEEKRKPTNKRKKYEKQKFHTH